MTLYFCSVLESQTSDEGTACTVLGDVQHGDASPLRTEKRPKRNADVSQINPEIQWQCKLSLTTLLMYMMLRNLFCSH